MASPNAATIMPNCATEEYASMRLTSDWITASTDPATMLTVANATSASLAIGTASKNAGVYTT